MADVAGAGLVPRKMLFWLAGAAAVLVVLAAVLGWAVGNGAAVQAREAAASAKAENTQLKADKAAVEDELETTQKDVLSLQLDAEAAEQKAEDAAATETKTAEAVEEEEPTTFADGIFVFGDDVPAGTYKTQGMDTSMPVAFCQATIRNGTTADAETLDQKFFTGPATFTFETGQSVETFGCLDFVLKE